MSNLRSLLPALSFVMLALAACGGASATPPVGSGSQPTKPAQLAATRSVASTPINATPTTSAHASTNSAAKVAPCAQLVPSDELKLILGVNPMTANEQLSAGSATCTWQYTPKNGTQEEPFQVQAASGSAAVDIWKSTREAEIKNEASGAVVNSIDGLRDENYTWVSKPSNIRLVYARRGDKTLILRFAPGILALSTESQIIDYADRLFGRF